MKNLKLLPSTLRDESIGKISFFCNQELIQAIKQKVPHYMPIWDVVWNKTPKTKEVYTAVSVYNEYASNVTFASYVCNATCHIRKTLSLINLKK